MPSVALRLLDRPGEPLALNVQVRGDAFTVTLDGTTYQGTFVLTGTDAGWLTLGAESGGQVLPFYLLREGNYLTVWIAGRLIRLERILPGARRATVPEAAGPHSGEIRAPLPGIVLKIPVQTGEQVDINAPLIILESMKMETTLVAPLNAAVTEILCAEGQMVEKGALLLKLEGTP